MKIEKNGKSRGDSGKIWQSLDKSWVFFAIGFLVLLAADQLSKWWAVANLEIGEGADFGFVLAYNDGVAFGFDMPIWVIYMLTALVLCLGVYLVAANKLWRDGWHLTGLALMAAGAVGNLIDRVNYGYVVDFIKIYWWPNFNLADVFLVMAVAVFFWEFFVREEGISEI
jgi:signal peptidase II